VGPVGGNQPPSTYSTLLTRHHPGSAVVAHAQLGADGPEVLHRSPAGARGTRTTDAMTLTLQLHLFLHQLKRSMQLQSIIILY